MKNLLSAFAALLPVVAIAQTPASAISLNAAAAFGARESVSDLRLSPDGKQVSYLVPTIGQGAMLYVRSVETGATAKAITQVDGKRWRLDRCSWVANDRLLCGAYTMSLDPLLGAVTSSRQMALNSDGSDVKDLATALNLRTHTRFAAAVVDWLPNDDGAVLVARGSIGPNGAGLGVDRIDTRTLALKQVVGADITASEYITDGRGTVRIVGNGGVRVGYEDGIIHYRYHPQGSSEWKKLGDYNSETREGFLPYAVDKELNVAYGLKKLDGRQAFYSVALDDSMNETLLLSRPDVDVDGPIQIGRNQRVVGASYVTDERHSEYFAPDIKQLLATLSKAVPGASLSVVDSSLDENVLLIFAGSDTDPGVYYIFDRKTRNLNTFLVVRSALEGVQLATVKSITYPSEDGVMIPGYLTLPPGRENAKGLPAIVLPHGGPSARDERGFDWLSQYFANRGYAVLQPNFRGSSGYGDSWFKENGFRSWEIAISDVLAAGHWLVRQGFADPEKLGIFGWSYGGYAALQSAVVDSHTFKAVVAVAPVTDLNALTSESYYFTNFEMVRDFIGSGPHIHEGSPVEHADKIKVPVMLFHGGLDGNVSIQQSRRMASRIKSAGGRVELITWDELDHQLDDSAARTELLQKSDDFLRSAFAK